MGGARVGVSKWKKFDKQDSTRNVFSHAAMLRKDKKYIYSGVDKDAAIVLQIAMNEMWACRCPSLRCSPSDNPRRISHTPL